MTMCLLDAKCQVEQAQAVLSVWMEADISDDKTMEMIGALMTLLRGVANTMGEADQELSLMGMKLMNKDIRHA
ncbi:hypothetical protein [Pantoea sp. AS-PWVM4]|uniref:hypothetical protein n=1 Tax=Pantoea sp. AS-PWVM4 TaxID=1332069 RepID=UPI001F1FFE15|nr:hypothetical protein [Pantoea sp. AS-PWVM4]